MAVLFIVTFKGQGMIDTHWLETPIKLEIDHNELSSVLFDLYDIKAALSQKVLKQKYNSDFDVCTIESGLNSVIEFLTSLEKQL
jgi:hypothetical protein